MQTEASLERDTDLIQDYIELLNRKAARPSPFGKLAALGRLGLLRRRLAAALRRHADPELERAAAAATAETTETWARRVATSYWGSRALAALVMVGGWQLLLVALLLASTAYVNLADRPPSIDSGYVPAVTRYAVVVLILFVFVFYAGLPLLAMLVLWGGRFLRAWRASVPSALLVLLAASVATLATFRGLENPAAAPDSIHEFVETRSTASSPEVPAYRAYQSWLDMNWLLKDPKLKADYEQYLRNGPGRWLTNKFDTTDPAAWAEPQTLVYIGELVDQQHDQAKFREWLLDYVERNRINSRDIDSAIDDMLQPVQQRFLSVWQAEPYLHDRDVNRRRHYFASAFSRMRTVGMIYFGVLVLLALFAYAVGPAVKTTGWLARVARFERVAGAAERFRDRYYALPEGRDLASAADYERAVDMLIRVHRAWVRAVLVVAILVFGGVAVWLATRSAAARPVATQTGLMHRFVAIPTSRPAASAAPQPANSPLPVAAAAAPGGTAFPGGTGDASVATDTDGDGVPDERAVPTLEARVAAIQKQLDDADYDLRKKFKTTAALLEAYRREIESLRSQNAQLEQRYTDLASTTSALGGRLGSAEAQARQAASAASAAEARAESVGVQVAALSGSVDERTGALARRADALEARDEEIQNTVDMVAADVDEKSTELRARTERLGERATDLAERTEQVAELQRTVYTALVDEFRKQIAAVERRSHSRLYRMFNKKEARAQLADLRRRIQLVRAKLQETGDPDAASIDRELVELQSAIVPVEERYK